MTSSSSSSSVNGMMNGSGATAGNSSVFSTSAAAHATTAAAAAAAANTPVAEPLDLCDAILGNVPCLVEYWLHTVGRDPNDRPRLTLFESIPKDHTTGQLVLDDTERILGETSHYTCTPLHVAILNCYHHGRMDGIAMKQRLNALKILDLLFSAGANVSATCSQVLFCHVGDLTISSPGAPLDPVALTLSLKKVKQSSIHADERIDMMDHVLEKIIQAKVHQQRHGRPSCVYATNPPIPQLVAQQYHDLCLSHDYSDVTIVCSDNTQFPAHCNILAVASPVLKKQLQTAAAATAATTEIPEGVSSSTSLLTPKPKVTIVMNRPPHIVKAVLQFIYTGTMGDNNNNNNNNNDAKAKTSSSTTTTGKTTTTPAFTMDELLERETATFLSVAAEYQMESLEQVCASKCGDRLTIHNVRLMLDIGHRHHAQWIKKECFDFLQRQPIPVVLGHPKLLAYATDHPKLWQEILMAVGGQYNHHHDDDDEKEKHDQQRLLPKSSSSS